MKFSILGHAQLNKGNVRMKFFVFLDNNIRSNSLGCHLHSPLIIISFGYFYFVKDLNKLINMLLNAMLLLFSE